jgi:hypothetical protein
MQVASERRSDSNALCVCGPQINTVLNANELTVALVTAPLSPPLPLLAPAAPCHCAAPEPRRASSRPSGATSRGARSGSTSAAFS